MRGFKVAAGAGLLAGVVIIYYRVAQMYNSWWDAVSDGGYDKV